MTHDSNSILEEKELLQAPDSRKIIQKVADDTSTLRASMSVAASQGGPPTIVSHDDSTIDSKIFDWDDDIVNADMYRRAMNHARSKSEMVAKQAPEKDERLDSTSQAATEESKESSDRLSPMESPVNVQHRKQFPYDISVASESTYGQQPKVVIPNSSMSDKPGSRRSLLAYRQKTPDTGKKSFWSSMTGKRSSQILVLPDRNTTSQSNGFKNPSSGSRRGRRGFENSYHTSIDFGSEDGLSAPPIVRAAQAGSVIEVETLLDQREDINARHFQSGRSALAVAAHCGNGKVVWLLLRYGAAVNERDASHLTPLHLASMRGHAEVVELLLQEHADVDVKGLNDQTPLRIAAEMGEVEVAEILLREGAKANARDTKQMTPLHVAAKQGDEAIAELLINNGAHVEPKDSSFMGPLHYACEGGHVGVVSLLLTKKAEVEAPGRASMSPLLCASSAGQVHAVEQLLKKKASIKHKGEGEMTVLHWASFNGHVEVVDLLLQRRAPIIAVNKDGRTPLHLAVMAEQFAVADLLLRKGASVEAQCKYMMRPIHYACTRAKPEIVQLLLGYNANIEAEDHLRNRPLHNACNRGSHRHVELLLQKGVNVDARNANGDRPLCLASSLGHLEIVRLLLNCGAPLRSKFASGPSHEDSPLCLAARNGHTPVVSELLIRGASVLQKDEQNWQPLRYAAFNAHPEVVELLLRYGATVSGSTAGGWGFNMTAQRIGFANDMIEEQRKAEVLRLLTNAEAREQKAQENRSQNTIPYVPPAVQGQFVPMELPTPNFIASPPAQAMQSSLPSLPSQPAHELGAPATSLPNNKYTYSSMSPPPNTIPAAGFVPQQQSPQGYRLANNAAPQIYAGNSFTTMSTQALPSRVPSHPGHHPQIYPTSISNPTPPTTTPQSPTPTTYTFVPKVPPQAIPSTQYYQAPQYPQSAGMPIYASPTSTQAPPAMTLGPDGLWRQMPLPGVQRVPSGRNTQALISHVKAPPPGVYEMAS